jgi:CHAT domain-containing protein
MKTVRPTLLAALLLFGASTNVSAQYVQPKWPGQDNPAQLQARAATLREMERLKFGGQAKQAIVLAEQLWQADLAASSPDSKAANPALFQSSYLAAILHVLVGDDERAIVLYQAALQQVRNGLFIDPTTRGRLIAGLLQSYQGAGQVDAAIAFLARAARDGSDPDAASLQRQSQLCRLYIKGRYFEQAEPACRLAQELDAEHVARMPAATFLRAAQTLNIRQSLFELAPGANDGSAALLRQADRVGNTAFSKPGESFLFTLSPYSMLAHAYFDKADRAALLALYDGRFRQYANVVDKALAGQAPTGFQPLEDDYARLGAYFAGAGMPAQADEALRKALHLNAARLSYVATRYNPLLLAGTLATRRAKASLYASAVLAGGGKDDAALKHMAGELMQAKGVQSEMLAIRHKAVYTSGNQALIDLYGKAEAAAAAGNEAEWETATAGLSAQLPYPAAELYDDGGRFLARVGARLGKKTLLSISRYTPFDFTTQAFAPARYLALRLKDGKIDARDIGAVDDIDLMVQRYRGEVGADHSEAGTSRVRQLARALYTAILAPLLGERLEAGEYVADLDGMLNLLPMEALVDGSSRYLVEAGTWRYVSSARALLRDPPAPATGSGKSAVLFVDPDFDSLKSGNDRVAPASADIGAIGATSRAAVAGGVVRFAPLPETRTEGQQIGRAMAGMGLKVSTIQGAAASPAALARLKAPRFLHIATHGFFLDDGAAPPAGKGAGFTNEALSGGLSAGIALAGANGRQASANADGLFFLSQFRLLDLSGTELVVLSACDTAVGSVRIGDGVNSLRQSLELAGAQAHVTSLWKVPSVATTRLMASFYQHLAGGASTPESLRQAKLDMLKSTPNPQFWAGFTASGSGD